VAVDARTGVLVALLVAAAGCAPPALKLPSGDSSPVADASPMLGEATSGCDTLTTITVEIGLSGRAGQVKLRGRLQAGFAAPDALRVEAIAPFGAPIFVLAGSGGTATLWLPRDERVLQQADPADILDALAGLHVSPADLRAWLAGCPAPGFAPGSARQYGRDWIQVDSGAADAVWLRRGDRWRVAAERAGPLTIEMSDYTTAGPGRVRIRRDAAADAPALDVRLAVGQVERNVTLGPEAFVVDVPASAQPITIDDLRASGPLRAADGDR
jgi:hypothetical protein